MIATQAAGNAYGGRGRKIAAHDGRKPDRTAWIAIDAPVCKLMGVSVRDEVQASAGAKFHQTERQAGLRRDPLHRRMDGHRTADLVGLGRGIDKPAEKTIVDPDCRFDRLPQPVVRSAGRI